MPPETPFASSWCCGTNKSPLTRRLFCSGVLYHIYHRTARPTRQCVQRQRRCTVQLEEGTFMRDMALAFLSECVSSNKTKRKDCYHMVSVVDLCTSCPACFTPLPSPEASAVQALPRLWQRGVWQRGVWQGGVWQRGRWQCIGFGSVWGLAVHGVLAAYGLWQ